MERDKIIRALDCCASSDNISACESGCPLWENDPCPCIDEPNALLNYALSLIKELTKENERLRTAIPLWAKQCVELEERCMQLRADTVRKMQERLKEHLEKPEFPWDSFTVSEEVIDQIAKEMLGEGK